MSNVGQIERNTQDRVVALFREILGYCYLGDWTDRHDNRTAEEALLTRQEETPRAIKQGMMQELLTGRPRLV